MNYLLIDDDTTFTAVLARALSRRGHTVHSAVDSDTLLALLVRLHGEQIDRVVLDLKLQQQSGLALLPLLKERLAAADIVVLTGYSSISTAVEAIKRGARDYLCKPAGVDEIIAAFESAPAAEAAANSDEEIQLESMPPSVERLEWEHIQRVLSEQQGNISATARALGMHRRTLQRKLAKRPVRR